MPREVTTTLMFNLLTNFPDEKISYWIIVRPKGTENYYPSEKPSPGAGGGAWATRVYSGPDIAYVVYLHDVTENGEISLQKYLDARKVDKQWVLGMADLPENNGWI